MALYRSPETVTNTQAKVVDSKVTNDGVVCNDAGGSQNNQ